jgi:hypothetical protein
MEREAMGIRKELTNRKWLMENVLFLNQIPTIEIWASCPENLKF